LIIIQADYSDLIVYVMHVFTMHVHA